jgi:hypothetical protein
LYFADIAGDSNVFQLNTTSYYFPDLVAATLDISNEPRAITEAVPLTYLLSPETAIKLNF